MMTILNKYLLLSGACLIAIAARAQNLRIYFIDVEGGQSTLVVTPDHQSFLIDTGFAGDGGNGSGYRPGDPHLARDANRIVTAAHDARIRRIDYLLITHFHDDHDGGVRELSQLMPIGAFIDHGTPHPQVASNTGVEQLEAFRDYASVRNGARHLQPKPGDRLPLKGVDVTVVSAAGSTLARPLPQGGSSNAACQENAPPARDPYENPRSTGVVIQYGRFRFLDVGDLSGQPLFDLVCPKNMIGPVDAYLVAHHGGPDVADPATFAAFKPRIAIMNNGLKKGGALETYQALHHVPGLETVWQLHLSAAAGASNFDPKYVANLDESTAHWIKLEANANGSFTVFNGRTGESTVYPARRR